MTGLQKETLQYLYQLDGNDNRVRTAAARAHLHWPYRIPWCRVPLPSLAYAVPLAAIKGPDHFLLGGLLVYKLHDWASQFVSAMLPV